MGVSLGNLAGKSKDELQELRDQLIIKGKISADDAVKILAEIERRRDASAW